jgi:aspartate kinase
LRARHLEVAGVITMTPERASVRSFINAGVRRARSRRRRAGVLREVSPRWLDAIAAIGEILSSRIVAAALSSRGWRRLGGCAKGDRHERRAHARRAALAEDDARAAETVDPVLDRAPHPVIGGFVGATTKA